MATFSRKLNALTKNSSSTNVNAMKSLSFRKPYYFPEMLTAKSFLISGILWQFPKQILLIVSEESIQEPETQLSLVAPKELLGKIQAFLMFLSANQYIIGQNAAYCGGFCDCGDGLCQWRSLAFLSKSLVQARPWPTLEPGLSAVNNSVLMQQSFH